MKDIWHPNFMKSMIFKGVGGFFMKITGMFIGKMEKIGIISGAVVPA
jgi:hypothetical protein